MSTRLRTPLRALCAHLVIAGLMTTAPAGIRAGALTDGTMGPVRSLAGAMVIPPTLGTTRGSNLFHSFSRFGISLGESANFQSTDAAVRNLIVRVTGSEATSIDGTIRLTAPAGTRPGLWFLNPNGIGVGPTGAFDVPGSLSLSTGQAVVFGDGVAWGANGGAIGSITVASPQSFGFVTGAPLRQLTWKGGGFSGQSGSALTLSGGSVVVDSAELVTRNAKLSIESFANITLDSSRLFSITSSGLPDGPSLSLISRGETAFNNAAAVITVEQGAASGAGSAEFVAGGDLLLGGASTIIAQNRATGVIQGDIRFRAEDIRLSGATDQPARISSTATAGSGAALKLVATGQVELKNAALINTSSSGSGETFAGDIEVSARSILLDAPTRTVSANGVVNLATVISSSALGNADGTSSKGSGSIRLQALEGVRLLGGAGVSIAAERVAGDIDIKAGNVVVDGKGGTALVDSSARGGIGDAGSVAIRATGSVQLLAGAQVNAYTRGTGSPGGVRLTADTITVDGTGGRITSPADGRPFSNTGIFAAAGQGAAGDIFLAARTVHITGNAGLFSTTRSDKAGGSIDIAANDITVSGGSTLSSTSTSGGNAGDISLRGNNIAILGLSELSSSTSGTGRAGGVSLAGDEVSVLGGSGLKSNTSSAGAGGVVYVQGRNIAVSGGANLSAEASGAGAGGLVDLVASDRLSIDGSSVSANTSGAGKGGNVFLQSTSPAGVVTLSNKAKIQTRASGVGDAGVTLLQADQVVLKDGAQVLVDTTGAGDGGIASFRADRVSVDGATVTTNTSGSGRGGFVSIDGRSLVSIANGSSVSADTTGSGKGGNVVVQSTSPSGVVTLSNAKIQTQAKGIGDAGSVSLKADQVLLSGGSSITTTTSGRGAGGFIQINGGSLVRLSGASSVFANAFGQGDGGLVSIEVTGSASASGRVPGALLLSGSFIESSSLSAGAGGGMVLKADKVVIDDKTRLFTAASGSGAGGQVLIQATDDFTIKGGSSIQASSMLQSTGNAGTTSIKADRVALEGATITSNTSGTGAGGLVSIEGRSLVSISNGSLVSANTSASGAGGFVTVQSTSPTGVVALSNAKIETQATGIGDAGITSLKADQVLLSGGSNVTTTTQGSGDGGFIHVTGASLVRLSGNSSVYANAFGSGKGGLISVEVNGSDSASGRLPGALQLSNSSIQSSSSGAGVGGDMLLRAGNVLFDDNSRLFTTASGNGNGGRIAIIATSNFAIRGGSAIEATSKATATGDAGLLVVEAAEVSLTGGARISMDTLGAGDGGVASIKADRVLMDGVSSISTATSGSGSGGFIDLTAGSLLRLGGASFFRADASGSGNGGLISLKADKVVLDGKSQLFTAAFGSGAGGSVRIEANDSVSMQGGSLIEARSASTATGRAGSVAIGAAEISLTDGAQIKLDTLGAGRGGNVLLVGDRVRLYGQAVVSSGTSGTGAGGTIQIEGGSSVRIANNSQVAADTRGPSQGGTVTIRAAGSGEGAAKVPGTLTIGNTDGPGSLSFDTTRISSSSNGSGNAGDISLYGDRVTIGQSSVSTGTFQGGLGGTIRIGATETVVVDRATFLASGNGGGDAGSISIEAEDISTSGGSAFLMNTFGSSNGGNVDFRGDRVQITSTSMQSNNLGSGKGGAVSITGKSSVGVDTAVLTAGAFGTGEGGRFVLGVESPSGSLSLKNATVRVDTFAAGNAGSAELRADRISIDGASTVNTNTASGGAGGAVRVTGGSLVHITGGSTVSGDTSGSGAGGLIAIEATGSGQAAAGGPSVATAPAATSPGVVLIEGGSQISTSAFDRGNAGRLTVKADRLLVDGGSSLMTATSSLGQGGNLSVTATDSVTLSGASQLSAQTVGAGQAGSVDVLAGGEFSMKDGATVQSGAAGAGHGGTVAVTADNMLMLSGSAIVASASGQGAAGSIKVQANSMTVSGTGTTVRSDATDASSGRPGQVQIRVVDGLTLSDRAAFSTANNARVLPSQTTSADITVQAGLLIVDGSQISASSTVNANAGSVTVTSSGKTRLLNNAEVSTTTKDGNGGPITLTSGGILTLKDSRITTSVTGINSGNGGDIAIDAPVVVLSGGFVQANTAATKSTGGQVKINTKLLLPNGSNAYVGGQKIFAFKAKTAGYNVIQAAAPDGVSGSLDIAQPELSVAGALAVLTAPRPAMGRLAYDLCEVPEGSSLQILTRGVLYPSASAPVDVLLSPVAQ